MSDSLRRGSSAASQGTGSFLFCMESSLLLLPPSNSVLTLCTELVNLPK